MTFYGSLMTLLIGMQLALVLLLLGPWFWKWLKERGLGIAGRVHEREIQRQVCARVCPWVSGVQSASM